MKIFIMLEILNDEKLSAWCEELSARDEDLAFIYRSYGLPPLWARAPGFATLLHIILEQQVSLASALAAFNKLSEKLKGAVTPENLLKLSDAEMKAAYFSRQKTVYARDLAAKIAEGKLNLERLENLPDEAVKAELKQVKGIGEWTCGVYLLMAMQRADVMPKGDLALHAAWQKLKNLDARPTADEFLIVAERWQPRRAVAARLLWHFYLNAKKISRERTRNDTK